MTSPRRNGSPLLDLRILVNRLLIVIPADRAY
jgi:hypothetical protein